MADRGEVVEQISPVVQGDYVVLNALLVAAVKIVNPIYAMDEFSEALPFEMGTLNCPRDDTKGRNPIECHDMMFRFYDRDDDSSLAINYWKTLDKVKHQNIIGTHGVFKHTVKGQPARYGVALQIASCTLDSFIDVRGMVLATPDETPRPTQVLVGFVKDTAIGLNRIHSANMSHGDGLTAQNVLLTKDNKSTYVAKLSMPAHASASAQLTREELSAEINEDYYRLGQMWKNANVLLNIENKEFLDLLDKLDGRKITSLKQILCHPSLWSLEQKASFIVRIVESCWPDQFKGKFLWMDKFHDLLKKFPFYEYDPESRTFKPNSSKTHNYDDTYASLYECLRDMLLHYYEPLNMSFRSYLKRDIFNLIRLFEEHHPKLLLDLIEAADNETTYAYQKSDSKAASKSQFDLIWKS